MTNPTKEELFSYALHKAREINKSEEQKYIHRQTYRQFVGGPISDGTATTYEDVDKLIEDSISTNPKSTEEQIYDQLEIDMKEKEKRMVRWCNTLNTDEVNAINKVLTMVGDDYYIFQTLRKIFNYQDKL